MLGNQERVVLQTLLPPLANPSSSEGVPGSGVEEAYVDFVCSANASWRMSLRLALLAAVWLSPLLVGRVPPLGLSDRPGREAALAALGSSRILAIRQLHFVLKSVAAFCCRSSPEIWSEFDRKPIERIEAAEQ
jgi:hypothetical protein